jgi:hypothetical protein
LRGLRTLDWPKRGRPTSAPAFGQADRDDRNAAVLGFGKLFALRVMAGVLIVRTTSALRSKTKISSCTSDQSVPSKGRIFGTDKSTNEKRLASSKRRMRPQ